MSQWPGVTVEERCAKYTIYEGKQDALLNTGLFKLEWFPGQPGNGKGSSTFVFTDENQREGYIKKPSTKKPMENGCGRARIVSTGAKADPLFRVWLTPTFEEYIRRRTAEETRSPEEQKACTGSDEWQRAKEARTDKSETLARWRNAISHRIAEIEKLCAGEAYFSEMPDVRIKGDDLTRVRDAVENLRRAFALTIPEMPDVVVRSNVYSIRDGAHRGLKKTG